MHTRASQQRGFTLMELLVVVLVLGIMAGVAGMAASDGAAQRLDLATIQVQDTVERARALAVSNRLAHGVVFDVNNDRLTIIDGNGNQVIDPLTQSPFLVEFRPGGQMQGIDISAAAFGDTESTALFDAQGVPLEAGAVILAAGTSSVTLTLDAATGRIE
ncbi:MAG: hypothetical protein DHS20C15_26530 [Planctomycetota bacterium]|nr:MAG: hypothetical protein DHS20C15_26530 [Planctomycetota bacterium]